MILHEEMPPVKYLTLSLSILFVGYVISTQVIVNAPQHNPLTADQWEASVPLNASPQLFFNPDQNSSLSFPFLNEQLNTRDKRSKVNTKSANSKKKPKRRLSSFAAKAISKMPLYGKFEKWRVDKRIESYGYPSETHVVQTEDGYLLTLYRIPNGKGQSATLDHRKKTKRMPVYVLHGLSQNSAIWLCMGNKSIAFLLADAGFDVWLGNHRGNVYSTGHVTLTPKDKAFWDFGMDEMSRFDLPAIIDYILFETSRKQIHYVGYSLGTMQFFAAMAVRPEYNKKIKKMVAMGFATHFSQSLPQFNYIIQSLPQFVKKNVGLLGKVRHEELTPDLIPSLNCLKNELIVSTPTCRLLLKMAAVEEVYNTRKNPICGKHLLDLIAGGLSRKTVLHVAQMPLKEGYFAYDYGKEGNLKKYGQEEPLQYNMSKVTVPIFGLYAQRDAIMSPLDTLKTIHELPKYVNPNSGEIRNWGHHSFYIDLDAPKLAYRPLIKFLKSRKNKFH